MNNLLSQVLENARETIKLGKPASYIPELSNTNPNYLGIYMVMQNKSEYMSGDYDVPFTIQSISKIIIFLACLMNCDKEDISKKVTVEPSNEGFNSIVSLENRNANRPFNPMINAGAIASLSLLGESGIDNRFEYILSLVRSMAQNDSITVNEKVYRSEKAAGSRNRSLAYYMLSTGIISEDVEQLLDDYFKICSLDVTCKDLARIAAVIANNGTSPLNGKTYFSYENAKIIRTVMSLCGMYDESGEYAVRVGIPSKSGVGGGILAAVPNKAGICVFSPCLNEKGSSIAGINVLEQLSRLLDLSIF